MGFKVQLAPARFQLLTLPKQPQQLARELLRVASNRGAPQPHHHVDWRRGGGGGGGAAQLGTHHATAKSRPKLLGGGGTPVKVANGGAPASAEAGSSKMPRAEHPLALTGKLLQQLKKDTLQNICEDLGAPVSGNKD